jgi:hypothetical protein
MILIPKTSQALWPYDFAGVHFIVIHHHRSIQADQTYFYYVYYPNDGISLKALVSVLFLPFD